MRWEPKKEFGDLLKVARKSLLNSDENTKTLAQGVIDLIDHIEKDEVAISATLEECGGHLTLSALIMHYKAMDEDLAR